jgi:hypothetical protein
LWQGKEICRANASGGILNFNYLMWKLNHRVWKAENHGQNIKPDFSKLQYINLKTTENELCVPYKGERER